MRNIQTLPLTLKQPWFNLMLTGEKTKEYRDPNKWIISRLFWQQNLYFPKKFDKIRFTNGYGAHRPWFEVEFLGVNKAILEVVRYFTSVAENGGKFKINNNVTPMFARQAVKDRPELNGFFELRRSKFDNRIND